MIMVDTILLIGIVVLGIVGIIVTISVYKEHFKTTTTREVHTPIKKKQSYGKISNSEVIEKPLRSTMGAILRHMIKSNFTFFTVNGISTRIKVSPDQVNEALVFLKNHKIMKETLTPTTGRYYLPDDIRWLLTTMYEF